MYKLKACVKPSEENSQTQRYRRFQFLDAAQGSFILLSSQKVSKEL